MSLALLVLRGDSYTLKYRRGARKPCLSRGGFHFRSCGPGKADSLLKSLAFPAGADVRGRSLTCVPDSGRTPGKQAGTGGMEKVQMHQSALAEVAD